MNQRNQRRPRPQQQPRREQQAQRRATDNEETGIQPTAARAARYIIRELELEDSVENWRTIRDAIIAATTNLAKNEDEPVPYYAK